jgi:pimeloyl-ACP methyl ester carboxylesterase
MTRALSLACLSVGLSVGLSLAACGPAVPPASPAPSLPPALDELDDWLEEREARFEDIVPGAEKHIDWADPEHPARTGVALVYLHGFGATRQEVDPMVQLVAEDLGANLFLTRLRGHGRGNVTDHGDPMGEATLADWLDDGREALAIGGALGERVVVVGTSTGGTLATWLATRPEGEDLAAMVLISPNYGPQATGSSLLRAPGRETLVKLIVGDTRQWEPANELQAKYWTWHYDSHALLPMADLVALARKADLSKVTMPSLFIYSPDDQVIRPDLVEERFADLGSPLKESLQVTDAGDPSSHVLAGRIMSPDKTAPLAEATSGFLRRALALPEATPEPAPESGEVADH